jgi:hypothetical protein
MIFTTVIHLHYYIIYMLVCTVDIKYYVAASLYITLSNPHLPPFSKQYRNVQRIPSPPLSLSSFSVVILSTTSSSREEILVAYIGKLLA